MSGGAPVSRHPLGIVFRRRLAQSPPVVFAAFADPAVLPRWWAPPSCPIVESSLDFRPGGVWLYRLDVPDSTSEVWSRAVFDEIETGRRIVFTETSADAAGGVTPERAPARTAVDFAPDAGGTLLTAAVAAALAALES